MGLSKEQRGLRKTNWEQSQEKQRADLRFKNREKQRGGDLGQNRNKVVIENRVFLNSKKQRQDKVWAEQDKVSIESKEKKKEAKEIFYQEKMNKWKPFGTLRNLTKSQTYPEQLWVHLNLTELPSVCQLSPRLASNYCHGNEVASTNPPIQIPALNEWVRLDMIITAWGRSMSLVK